MAINNHGSAMQCEQLAYQQIYTPRFYNLSDQTVWSSTHAW